MLGFRPVAALPIAGTVPQAASGAQTLLPALFTDGDTFFTHTLNRGAVTLTASLFSDGDTFFTHTLTQAGGPVTLLPSLFSDGDTFFAHTLTQGATVLLPSLFTDGDTFFTHTLTGSAVTLLPSLFTDGDTFFAAAASVPIKPVAPSFSHWAKTKDKNKPKAPPLPPPVEAGEVVVDEAFLRQMEEERLAALALKAKQEALQRVEELRAHAFEHGPTKPVTLARKAAEAPPGAPARYVSLARPEPPPPQAAAPRTVTLNRDRFDVVETTPEVRTQVVTLFRPPPKAPLVEPIKGSITVRALGPRHLPEPDIRKARTISLRRSANRAAKTG